MIHPTFPLTVGPTVKCLHRPTPHKRCNRLSNRLANRLHVCIVYTGFNRPRDGWTIAAYPDHPRRTRTSTRADTPSVMQRALPLRTSRSHAAQRQAVRPELPRSDAGNAGSQVLAHERILRISPSRAPTAIAYPSPRWGAVVIAYWRIVNHSQSQWHSNLALQKK